MPDFIKFERKSIKGSSVHIWSPVSLSSGYLEEKFLIESGDILDPNQQAKLGLFKQKMMKDMKGKMKKRKSRRKIKERKKQQLKIQKVQTKAIL